MSVTQFDPKHPERGWHEAKPMPEPRIWKLWRLLGIGDFKRSKATTTFLAQLRAEHKEAQAHPNGKTGTDSNYFQTLHRCIRAQEAMSTFTSEELRRLADDVALMDKAGASPPEPKEGADD